MLVSRDKNLGLILDMHYSSVFVNDYEHKMADGAVMHFAVANALTGISVQYRISFYAYELFGIQFCTIYD